MNVFLFSASKYTVGLVKIIFTNSADDIGANVFILYSSDMKYADLLFGSVTSLYYKASYAIFNNFSLLACFITSAALKTVHPKDSRVFL